MGSVSPPVRRQEVTRKVSLSSPDGLYRGRSTTPYQEQSVAWDGPIQLLFEYSLEDVGSSQEWWLDRIHPDDQENVLRSLTKHLIPTPKNRFAAEARIWGHDYRFRNADGSFVMVSDRAITTRDEQGNASCLESVIFNKEARRRERESHAKVLRSQDHLALIANNTPSGIFMLDPQGYCTYMNNAAEQITGFRYQEIHDYTFHASVHSCHPNGDPFPIQECPVYGQQRKGVAVKNEPEIFVHKDGHHFDIEYSISPIGHYDSGGAVIEFRDVTDQKRIERERLNAILMTEQQSIRIKADEVHKANMTSFVSFVCHELRNPLQGVTSSAEFLLDTLQKLDGLTRQLSTVRAGVLDQDPVQAGIESHGLTPTSNTKHTAIGQRQPFRRTNAPVLDAHKVVEMEGLISYAKQLVGNIQTCAEHQGLITNNVLDLTRLDAGKVDPVFGVVDIQALGHEAAAMMSSKAQRKQINLSVSGEGAQPLYLKADATILRQVLLNLVSNAIKYTPEHGRVTVDLYADPPNGEGQVVLHGSVTDNGLGMSESDQQKLFQRFSQVNRKVAQLYGGSGLGLSISKELVKVMGGDMHVESALGKGSTFSFTSLHDVPTTDELVKFLRHSNFPKDGLPADPSPGDDESVVSKASSDPPPKFRMIGVAEDNPINLQCLAKHLKVLGYQYVLCTNGEEILDKFCEPDSTIECCILDMSMPVMDGLESARRIRQFESSRSAQKACRRTPLIALSGNALMEQVTDAMSAGISDYLIKPCKRLDLARTLTHWEYVVHAGAEHKPTFDKMKVAS